MDAASMRDDIEQLLAAQARLRRRSLDEIIDGLDAAVRSWLTPASPWFASAEEALVSRAGFAREMVRTGLPRMFEPLRGDCIRRLLQDELPDDFDGAAGPALVAHVLPGNVPALAAGAICQTLAVKAAALVKPGSGEPWSAPLFADSLAAVDADLAACVAVRCWAGGSADIEEEVFRRADVVEASGGDEAVAAIRTRVRGRFVGRGARLSFAAIGREVVEDAGELSRAAASIAEDVAIWEQRGCLSPQVVFVEARSPAALEKVVEALGAALDEMARRWPPPPLSLDEKAALLRFRQAAEWGLGGEPGGRLIAGKDTAWTIVLERAAQLRPTCLRRTLRLQPIADLNALAPVCEPLRSWLEGAGVAVEASRIASLSKTLRAAGVHRVCRVGEMQRPDLTWKPGGVPRLAAWMSTRT